MSTHGAAATQGLHFFDGTWHEGNQPAIGVWDQASWLGAAVFDGARAFEGVTPDLHLHCQRLIRSARALGMNPKWQPEDIENIIRDGVAKFPADVALYLRPLIWAAGGMMIPDADDIRLAVSVVPVPMPEPKGFSVCLSRFRRPTAECGTTDAKAVANYALSGRVMRDAKARGFDDAIMLDLLGHVSEYSGSNLWIAKDGAAHTPIPNGTFLNGLTRQRVMRLLREGGIPVYERSLTFQDVMEADEVFSTGNYSKVSPVTRVEERYFQPGPVYKRARELYWEFAHGKRT